MISDLNVTCYQLENNRNSGQNGGKVDSRKDMIIKDPKLNRGNSDQCILKINKSTERSKVKGQVNLQSLVSQMVDSRNTWSIKTMKTEITGK